MNIAQIFTAGFIGRSRAERVENASRYTTRHSPQYKLTDPRVAAMTRHLHRKTSPLSGVEHRAHGMDWVVKRMLWDKGGFTTTTQCKTSLTTRLLRFRFALYACC